MHVGQRDPVLAEPAGAGVLADANVDCSRLVAADLEGQLRLAGQGRADARRQYSNVSVDDVLLWLLMRVVGVGLPYKVPKKPRR